MTYQNQHQWQLLSFPPQRKDEDLGGEMKSDVLVEVAILLRIAKIGWIQQRLKTQRQCL